MKQLQHIGVVGGGAWGTALALALLRAGRDVTLWAREEEVVASVLAQRENTLFLPGIRLDEKLAVTNDMRDLKACDALWIVCPVQPMRAVCTALAESGLSSDVPLVLCAKGIERERALFPSQIAEDVFKKNPIAVLSGPSFAIEVAEDKPTAVTLACRDAALGEALCTAIGSMTFRPYRSEDVLGAQIGGAIKNVLAVATGIAQGSGMGENARAALITRGLAEMMRFGAALGARPETLMGLSGLGDLVLTCSSTLSRNMSLGLALGQGKSLDEILGARRAVTEGVYTASVAARMAHEKGVDMPIVAAVDAVLGRGADVAATIRALLSRPLRAEGE